MEEEDLCVEDAFDNAYAHNRNYFLRWPDGSQPEGSRPRRKDRRYSVQFPRFNFHYSARTTIVVLDRFIYSRGMRKGRKITKAKVNKRTKADAENEVRRCLINRGLSKSRVRRGNPHEGNSSSSLYRRYKTRQRKTIDASACDVGRAS